MRIFLLVGLVAVPFLSLELSACSDAGSEGPSSPDAAADGATAPPRADAGPSPRDGSGPPTDAERAEASPAIDAPPPLDAGLGDAAAQPALTLVAAGPIDQVGGITTDGQIVYTAGGAVLAASVSGGAPQTVLQASGDAGSPTVLTYGAAAFIRGSGGTLSAWTAAHGLHQLSTTPSVVTTASDDGSWVAFNEIADATTTRLVVSASDGSGRVVALPNAGANAHGLTMYFVGDVLVASYCNPVDAGGFCPTSTLVACSPPSWNPVVLGSEVGMWAVDPTATYAYVQDLSSGAGKLVPLASPGAATVVDQGGTDGVFASKSTLFYDKSVGGNPSLHVVSTATANQPVTLANNAMLSSISPDAKYAAYATGYSAQGAQDLYVVSVAAPLSPIVVDATQEVSPFTNEGYFTADSAYVVYTAGAGHEARAQSLAGGAPVVIGEAAAATWRVRGSTVVVAGNAAQDPTYGELSTLHLVDVAAPASSITMASGVRQNDLAFTLDGRYAAFFAPRGPATGKAEGLYVVATY